MNTKVNTLISFCLFLFATSKIQAQIYLNGEPDVRLKVGENPFLDATTFDDGTSIGKGLIFPRTDLTRFDFKTTGKITTGFDGMIVYNSATGTTVPGKGQVVNVKPGYYYFYNPGSKDNLANGKWIPFVPESKTITASNGLTATNGNVTLGGSLTQDTNINLTRNILSFKNSTTNQGTYTFGSSNTDNSFLTINNPSNQSGIQLSSGSTTVSFWVNPNLGAILRTADNDFTISTFASYPLNFGTNNINRMVISPTGNVGIGTSTPISTLEINGSATNTSSFEVKSVRTIDFSKSNFAFTTTFPAGSFTITGIKDGGSYTFAIQNTTSGTASFTANGFNVHLPTDNGATTAGKHTLYNFIVIGTEVYTTWQTGL